MTSTPALLPEDDAARVRALHDLQILDTLPEQSYDDLALLAASICGTPIALVSLVDAERQWFKSKLGLGAAETHRDLAFCSHAILEPEAVFAVPDTHADARFATNELVTDGPKIRAYAGAPIVMDSGAVLGTLCVIDTLPRTLTTAQSSALQALARQVAGQLELRRANLHLEATVEARTRDLQVALEAAEAASRAKSAFVSAMSHEIRTPMNGVVGMIDVLERSPLEASQRELVAMARASSRALLRIVDDVLDFSTIEAGGLAIDRAPLSLEHVTRQACDTLALLARRKGVTVAVDVDAGLPAQVLGDATRLRQVLLNLVGNAIKFSSGEGRAGVVGVRVATTERAGDRCTVELVVSDNGVGIDAETRERLFSPFTQADSGTTKRFGGTGLGLCISSRLVGLMGGRITVDSEVGRGSRFAVHLPFACVEAAAVPAAPVQDAGAVAGDAGRQILVAEDNEMNQHVIRRQLALLGFSADIAETGRAALEKFASGRYALLLTDLHMPAMDGFELAARIRVAEADGIRLPIVALTADASVGAKAKCRDAGMDDCLTKPLPLAHLHAMLKSRLPDDLQPLPLR